MTRQPTALLYGVSGHGQAALGALLRPIGLRTLAVSAADTGLPLEVVLGLRPRGEKPASGMALPEPMLIFHALTDAQLDAALAALRTGGFSAVLKAVTTPTNLRWSGAQTFFQLKLERQSFQQ